MRVIAYEYGARIQIVSWNERHLVEGRMISADNTGVIFVDTTNLTTFMPYSAIHEIRYVGPKEAGGETGAEKAPVVYLEPNVSGGETDAKKTLIPVEM